MNIFVKTEGKSTYRSIEDCGDNKLAQSLFQIRGVDNLHFFQNTITVTKFSYMSWFDVEEKVEETIKENLPEHNPDYEELDPEVERRKNLPPELLEVEEILDRTIRPGLQADGGDVVCIEFNKDVLMVKYQGACGTCPSSTTGTLQAIKQILSDELNKPIEVYALPEMAY